VTFKELREASGMSRGRFAEYFEIPYRTVQNWELGLRECPEYLMKLIQFKLNNERRAGE
jgi:DNA-binding transcriptional regulator YiaG